MRISFAKAPFAFQALSEADVINDRIDTSILNNAWVIVGGTAFGMADIVPTPYSGAAFGVELQARLLTSMLDMSMPFTLRRTAVVIIELSGFRGSALPTCCSR